MKTQSKFLSKRGVLGLDTVKAVFISMLVLAVIGIAVALALVSLNNSNIFTADSVEANQTTNIINNITTAQAEFFSNTGTIYAILVAVVIILAVALIIAVVSRFGGTSGSAGL